MTKALEDIAAERRRQIEVEGWTPERDDEYASAEMATAAACYALTSGDLPSAFMLWPWDGRWWKPTNPRRDLVKAGALIVAEIERLDRASSPQQHVKE